MVKSTKFFIASTLLSTLIVTMAMFPVANAAQIKQLSINGRQFSCNPVSRHHTQYLCKTPRGMVSLVLYQQGNKTMLKLSRNGHIKIVQCSGKLSSQGQVVTDRQGTKCALN